MTDKDLAEVLDKANAGIADIPEDVYTEAETAPEVDTCPFCGMVAGTCFHSTGVSPIRKQL
jgi:hypothetical protein